MEEKLLHIGLLLGKRCILPSLLTSRENRMMRESPQKCSDTRLEETLDLSNQES